MTRRLTYNLFFPDGQTTKNVHQHTARSLVQRKFLVQVKREGLTSVWGLAPGLASDS